MSILLLFVLMVLSLSHWLFEPVLMALTPAFSLVGIGWIGLLMLLWLLAGTSSDEPPRHPKP